MSSGSTAISGTTTMVAARNRAAQSTSDFIVCRTSSPRRVKGGIPLEEGIDMWADELVEVDADGNRSVVVAGA